MKYKNNYRVPIDERTAALKLKDYDLSKAHTGIEYPELTARQRKLLDSMIVFISEQTDNNLSPSIKSNSSEYTLIEKYNAIGSCGMTDKFRSTLKDRRTFDRMMRNFLKRANYERMKGLCHEYVITEEFYFQMINGHEVRLANVYLR